MGVVHGEEGWWLVGEESQGLVVDDGGTPAPGQLDETVTGRVVELSAGGVVDGRDMDEIDTTFIGGECGGPLEVVDAEGQEPGAAVEVGVERAEVGGVLDHDAVVAFEVGGDERQRLLGAGGDQELRWLGGKPVTGEVVGECRS